MSDLSSILSGLGADMAPNLATLAQMVGALTTQLGLANSDVSKAPKGASPFAWQAWNIGQLDRQLAVHTNPADIAAQARQMFPNFDSLPPDQQQIALQYANVTLMASLNRSRASKDQLTPGTATTPNIILDSQIRQQFGAEAWMLDIPELRVILEKAVAGGWQQAQITTAVQGTQWYQDHSQAQRDFVALAANNPAELNFSNQGSQAAQAYLQVQNDASKFGLTLDPSRIQKIALDALQFRWNDAEINQALSSEVHFDPNAAAGGATGQNDANTLIQQLKTQGAQYFQNLDPATLQTFAQQIVAGSQTMDTFSKHLADMASQKWVGMAPQIAQGLTPQQITSGMRQTASQLMEIQPAQVDFVNDPTYQKILDYVAPNDPNGVHRLMTQSEMATYLRGTNQWGNTQQARDLVASQARSILQTFGKVG